MSTRQQRRDWQEFREKHGPTVQDFRRRWQAMFNRPPTDTEEADYLRMRNTLRAPLGRKAKETRRETHWAPPEEVSQLITVTRKYEWDMGHRLPDHTGKCARLHGHRYVAEIDITGRLLTAGSAQGMVMDFDDLDGLIRDVIGPWDHRTLLHDNDPMNIPASYGIIRLPFTPTAENLCREIKRRLEEQPSIVREARTVTRVRVYETPKGWAEIK